MQYKYIGDDDNPATEITMFGVLFPAGEAVDCSHLPAELQAKLAGNWHFEAVGKKRGRKPKTIEDVTDDELEALTAPDGE